MNSHTECIHNKTNVYINSRGELFFSHKSIYQKRLANNIRYIFFCRVPTKNDTSYIIMFKNRKMSAKPEARGPERENPQPHFLLYIQGTQK